MMRKHRLQSEKRREDKVEAKVKRNRQGLKP
jgi:hypothetical protein